MKEESRYGYKAEVKWKVMLSLYVQRMTSKRKRCGSQVKTPPKILHRKRYGVYFLKCTEYMVKISQ